MPLDVTDLAKLIYVRLITSAKADGSTAEHLAKDALEKAAAFCAAARLNTGSNPREAT